MATITRFEDLEIWKLARKNYGNISGIADRLKGKRENRFADQMKCSAGSIMDNIAEGFERNSRLEFINSLSISKGEGGELKSQLYRCLDNRFISQDEFDELYEAVDKVIKKIGSFIKYLNESAIKGLKFKNRRS